MCVCAWVVGGGGGGGGGGWVCIHRCPTVAAQHGPAVIQSIRLSLIRDRGLIVICGPCTAVADYAARRIATGASGSGRDAAGLSRTGDRGRTKYCVRPRPGADARAWRAYISGPRGGDGEARPTTPPDVAARCRITTGKRRHRVPVAPPTSIIVTRLDGPRHET